MDPVLEFGGGGGWGGWCCLVSTCTWEGEEDRLGSPVCQGGVGYSTSLIGCLVFSPDNLEEYHFNSLPCWKFHYPETYRGVSQISKLEESVAIFCSLIQW